MKEKSFNPHIKDPLFLLSVCTLAILIMFFSEITALYQPFLPSMLYKYELFFIQLIFVLSVLLNRKVSFPVFANSPRSIIGFGMAWLVWSGISVTQAIDPYLSAMTYAEHVTLLLFGVTVYSFINTYRVLQGFLLIAVIVGFLIYVVFLAKYHLFSPDPRYHIALTNLSSVGFRHIRHLGYYLAIILVFSAGICAVSNFNLKRSLTLLGVITMVIAWALIFWAGGRGPIVAFLVSLGLFLMLFGFNQNKEMLIIVFSTMMIGIVMSSHIPKGLGVERINKTISNFNTDSGYSKFNKLSSDRLNIWRACLEDIKNSPFFGIGANNYRKSCGKVKKESVHPHGLHIQAALDWGVPGAIMFFLFIGSVLFRAYKNIRKTNSRNSLREVAFWAGIMLLCFSIIDGTLYHRFTLMFFSFCLAVASLPVKDDVVQKSNGDHSRNLYVLMMLLVASILVGLSLNDFALIQEDMSILRPLKASEL